MSISCWGHVVTVWEPREGSGKRAISRPAYREQFARTGIRMGWDSTLDGAGELI